MFLQRGMGITTRSKVCFILYNILPKKNLKKGSYLLYPKKKNITYTQEGWNTLNVIKDDSKSVSYCVVNYIFVYALGELRWQS